MSRILQPLTAVIVGLLCVLAIYESAPVYDLKPKGILLPAKTLKSFTPSSPSSISISTNAPRYFQPLGYIRIEMHYTGGAKINQIIKMETLAKSLAAKVGANMVIRLFKYVPEVVSPLNESVYYGLAIKSNPDFLPLEPGIVLPTS